MISTLQDEVKCLLIKTNFKFKLYTKNILRMASDYNKNLILKLELFK